MAALCRLGRCRHSETSTEKCIANCTKDNAYTPVARLSSSSVTPTSRNLMLNAMARTLKKTSTMHAENASLLFKGRTSQSWTATHARTIYSLGDFRRVKQIQGHHCVRRHTQHGRDKAEHEDIFWRRATNGCVNYDFVAGQQHQQLHVPHAGLKSRGLSGRPVGLSILRVP